MHWTAFDINKKWKNLCNLGIGQCPVRTRLTTEIASVWNFLRLVSESVHSACTLQPLKVGMMPSFGPMSRVLSVRKMALCRPSRGLTLLRCCVASSGPKLQSSKEQRKANELALIVSF